MAVGRLRPGGTGGLNHGYPYVERAIDEVVESLSAGRPSSLGVDNALDAMKMVFGTYESVRSRGRVDFPLTVEDNPLESMLDAGTLRPE